MSDTQQGQGGLGSPSRPPLTPEDLTHHSQELGVLGKIFGSKEHAPSYIAAMSILFAFVGIILAMIYTPNSTQVITLFGAIITGALGYVFGRSS